MDISIAGYKLNLEILIFIGIIYIILVSHTLCGCCNQSLMESFQAIGGSDASGNSSSSTDSSGNNSSGNKLLKAKILQSVMSGTSDGSGNTAPSGGSVSTKSKSAGKEGFSGANINYGQSSPYDLTSGSSVDTSSWMAQDMTVTPGKQPSQGVTDFLNRPAQQLPLPEGEMLLFANTPFKKECCPNTYSTSSGCSCMTSGQYNFLKMRGMNNVPYSEY